MRETVGQVTAHIAALLSLDLPDDCTIYLGDSNRKHMESSHPEDFLKYGQYLKVILAEPDFVGQNPSDGSIEFVKTFQTGNDYVKVAVRLSKSDQFYARSLYVLNPNRVERFIEKGTLKKA